MLSFPAFTIWSLWMILVPIFLFAGDGKRLLGDEIKKFLG